jgi:TatA/E family protein of Tat protein translocase
MGAFSPIHWIVAAVVILLVFGPKALSKVGKTAGRTVRTATKFKKALTDAPTEIVRSVTSTPPSGDDKS